MNTFTFERFEEDEVIIVNASIGGKYKFRLALDTAATHTTIDSNVLYFSGYELNDSHGEVNVETSNGIIRVQLHDVVNFECLGIVQDAFTVQVYDFLAHGIISEYDGVVGLNFLKNRKICIDFIKSEITVQ